MEFSEKDLAGGQCFMTPQQFMAVMQNRKCSHCDKKATWIHQDGLTPSYCDSHFPYIEEKRREAAKDWEEFQNMSEEDRIKKIRQLNEIFYR